MAATAVYFRACRIPKGDTLRNNDAVLYTNISATTANFQLLGGTYGLINKASTYGSVTLQILADDGATWLNAVTPFGADGTAVADLPPGTYRVVLA